MDKKDREMLEERRKKAEPLGWVALVIIIMGLVPLFMAMFSVNTLALELKDGDHITDDSIAMRDMDNATYTWTAQELEDMLEGNREMVLVGAGVLAIGIALIIPTMVFSHTPIEKHRKFCKNDGEQVYCPECGIKLSRLEPKK